MKKLLGKIFLWLVGWKPYENKITLRKFVLVAAPHTSNWDLPIMLSIGWVYGLSIGWIGKHTLFQFPFGWFMRALGGIPIDRSARQNLVAHMAEVYRKADSLVVAIPPEGTRKAAPYWKSGFYHIARGAGVPIVLGVLDYKERRGGFGPVIEPTGDLKADMDKIRTFYKDKAGKFPANFGPIRLKEEAEQAA
ncbi:MAG: lysophospholipid acyltransferase family protein [Bdellovibrionota bacterium]